MMVGTEEEQRSMKTPRNAALLDCADSAESLQEESHAGMTRRGLQDSSS